MCVESCANARTSSVKRPCLKAGSSNLGEFITIAPSIFLHFLGAVAGFRASTTYASPDFSRFCLSFFIKAVMLLESGGVKNSRAGSWHLRRGRSPTHRPPCRAHRSQVFQFLSYFDLAISMAQFYKKSRSICSHTQKKRSPKAPLFESLITANTSSRQSSNSLTWRFRACKSAAFRKE